MSTPDPNAPQYQRQPGAQQPGPQAQQGTPGYQYASGASVPPMGQATGQPQMQQPYNEPPQDQPWYGISFLDAIKRFFTKYADFSGRASRGEYWWAFLLGVLVTLVIDIISSATTHRFGNLLSLIWGLGTLVPYIAVGVRRLHDANRSGWWLFLPYGLEIGAILIMVIGMLIAFAGAASSPFGYMRYDHSVLGQGVWAVILGCILALAGVICQIVMMVSASNPAGVRFDKRPMAPYAYANIGFNTTGTNQAYGQRNQAAYQQPNATNGQYYGQAQAQQPVQPQQQYQQPIPTAQPTQPTQNQPTQAQPQQPNNYGQQ